MQPEQLTEKNQPNIKLPNHNNQDSTFKPSSQETAKVPIQNASQKGEKPGLKKKIKNKGWDTTVQIPVPSQVKSIYQKFNMEDLKIQKKQNRYANISEMSAKYTFNIQAVLGSGFASTVYLGNRNSNNQMICIKAIDLMTIGFGLHSGLIHQQIECLKLFQSEYIVKLYDIYQSNTFIYLIMELCPGGDLYKMLKRSPNDLPCKFVNAIMKQITHGMKEIHDKQLIHRDMKTQNIFILKFPQNQNEQIRVKIGDLGFCISTMELQKMKKMGRTPQNVGSPIYMSLEVCQKLDYSFSSDVYSIGIIWYQLFHKKAPWEARSQSELLNKKQNEQVKIWRQDINPSLKQIILRSIDNDPNKRPTCDQIIKFIQSFDEKTSKKQQIKNQ